MIMGDGYKFYKFYKKHKVLPKLKFRCRYFVDDDGKVEVTTGGYTSIILYDDPVSALNKKLSLPPERYMSHLKHTIEEVIVRKSTTPVFKYGKKKKSKENK